MNIIESPDPLFDLPLPKTVVDSDVEASGFPKRPQRPASGDIVVERDPDGVTIIVPPRGVGRSAGGCLCLFLGLMFLGGVLVALLAAAGIVDVYPEGQNPWAGLICLIPGLPLVIVAIEVGRRRVVLVVAGGMVRIMTTSPFWSRDRRWRREELDDIRTGPSGYEINDCPLTELQIHLRSGAKFGFLVGRGADELAFLATALRWSLHLPAKKDRLR